MPTQVRFYIINARHHLSEVTTNDTITTSMDLGCRLASTLFREGKRVFMFAENEQDAHLIDEYLWAFEADTFVPHNLAGEGPRHGSPVEISYSPPSNQRDVMINFASLVPDFFNQFKQIIDFVPTGDKEKQAARARYKYYRQYHCSLETVNM